VKQYWPAIAGTPVTFQPGDKVITRGGKVGKVLKSSWKHDLVLYRDPKKEPEKGFFIVTVDFGGYKSDFLRHDLSGQRLVGGFW